MNEEEKYLRRAVELSRTHMASGAGGPFGAVIVRDGKVVGEGWNQVTSTQDPTAHAEVMAIRQACQNTKNFSLKGAVIYTSCEPCPMCLAAIYWARLDGIFYGNSREQASKIGFDDEFLYEEISRPIPARSIPMKQCLPEEAHRVFEEWQTKTDKVLY